MLTKVHLHGHLAQFGGPYELDVQHAPEAARALCMQVDGFRDALKEGSYKIIRGDMEKGMELDQESIFLGAGKEMHFVPVIEGSLNRGAVGKVVLGAAFIAAAWYLGPLAFGPAGATSGATAAGASSAVGGPIAGTAGVGAINVGGQSAIVGAGVAASSSTISGAAVAGVFTKIGIGLALFGLASLLSDKPSDGGGEGKSAFIFGVPTNTSTQGSAIPIVYGEMVVGSVTISSGLDVEEDGTDYSNSVNAPDDSTTSNAYGVQDGGNETPPVLYNPETGNPTRAWEEQNRNSR